MLVYPQIVTIPLILHSSHLPPDFNLREVAKRQWENLPTFSDIITRNEKFFDEEKQHIFTKKINISKLIGNQYLYPNIISRIHGNASHYFSRMVLKAMLLKAQAAYLWHYAMHFAI